MVIASTRRSFALAAILANALVRTASAGFKAECFSRSDCTGPVLVNGDGNCSMPLREALDGRDPTYPLVPGYPSAYYRGPTIGGILREDVCDSRESVVSAAEAIQYCFDIGAKSSCESKPNGCDCMQNPMSWGETHFRSYGGEDFDFHGVCDLVLFSAPEMNTTIHVRTEQKFEYSYISNAAILINGDILEIGGWGKVIWNGIEDWDLPPTLGGYPLAVKHINRKNTVFTIDVGHGQQIRFKAYKSMVAVSLQLSQHGGFRNSAGIMGSGATGLKLGRDGKTVFSDDNDYGFEWQVRDDETMLFDAVREPQYPDECILPNRDVFEKRRRLGEVMAREVAERACAKWGLNKEQCIYDVMVTGDLDAAQAGVF